ncbi:MAG TPA: adenylosuccinate lyase [Anaerolineaceae bacterium]
MTDFTQYQSPFSWRYASPEMRSIWSEIHKRQLWRQIWTALARAQQAFGLVSQDQLTELEAHAGQVDLERALEIEAEIHHDLMAELKVFAEQCPGAGGILHLGATSMDIEDNADAQRLCQAMELVLQRLDGLLLVLADQIDFGADLPVMAFTHLQPAEPTTLGYRLASYAQDLLEDRKTLTGVRAALRGKGFKGAVGTGAAYADLIGLQNFAAFEESLSKYLKLPFYPVSAQTYPRKQDYQVVSALAGLGASLHKMAFDLRLLQSPPIGELSEPFGSKQVGSSAMPFKRNPINAEKIDSLARLLAGMPAVAWHNAANSLLERTLDDSANRRTLLPESFLIVDELLITAQRILKGLKINREAIRRNLEIYAPFAATERVLMAAAGRGADRQEMHERLRMHAMAAWQEVQAGKPNPLLALLASDGWIRAYLPADELLALGNVDAYTGIAPQRSREIAASIRSIKA